MQRSLAVDAGLADTFPGNAAGALISGYLDMPGYTNIRAVTIEALTADGTRPDGGPWCDVRGAMAGAACVMPGSPAGSEIAIVEDECDGLAVALMAVAGVEGYGTVNEVRAVGDADGFQPDRAADSHGRPVLLLPDGTAKAAGRAAGCATRLRAAGRKARDRMRPAGDEAGDPAGDLAALLVERSIRFERTAPDDSGEIRRADRLAWRSILGLDTEGER